MDDPDAVCAGCLREIYDRYGNTPMGLGSGRATARAQTGEFTHPTSGITYRVFLRDGALWMSYSRVSPAEGERKIAPLQGERRLQLFVGSGHRGRTYLTNRTVNGSRHRSTTTPRRRSGTWLRTINGAARCRGLCLWIRTACTVPQLRLQLRCLRLGTGMLRSRSDRGGVLGVPWGWLRTREKWRAN